MDFCEHNLPSSSDSLSSDIADKLIIQDELIWGMSYRNYKNKIKNDEIIAPTPSPIDIPFKICRAEQHALAKAKKAKPKVKKPCSPKKLSLLERQALPQSKYMELLSTPNAKSRGDEERPDSKKCCKCVLEPCPPRLVQLAVPNKRLVFANWKQYYQTLPTEMVSRFEQILHTDQNLEPKEARYYFKQLDQKKKIAKRKAKQRKKKKENAKRKGDRVFTDKQIEETAKMIMEYVEHEPLFSLNYKQMLLSDEILNALEKSNSLKGPINRTTKNHFKKTSIEICDKFAVWFDTVTRFVDVQAVESDADIPIVEVCSLKSFEGEEEGESEVESEQESSSESEGESEIEDVFITEPIFGEEFEEDYDEDRDLERQNLERIQEDQEDEDMEEDDLEGSDEEGEDRDDEGEGEPPKKSVEGAPPEDLDTTEDKDEEAPKDEDEEVEGFVMVKSEDAQKDGDMEVALEDHIASLDRDSLARLIKILQKCSDTFLAQIIDDEKMPKIKYKDILDIVKTMKIIPTEEEAPKPFLEDVMIQWAVTNEPDKVDSKILNKIHETAGVLTNMFDKISEQYQTKHDGMENEEKDKAEAKLKEQEKLEAEEVVDEVAKGAEVDVKEEVEGKIDEGDIEAEEVQIKKEKIEDEPTDADEEDQKKTEQEETPPEVKEEKPDEEVEVKVKAEPGSEEAAAEEEEQRRKASEALEGEEPSDTEEKQLEIVAAEDEMMAELDEYEDEMNMEHDEYEDYEPHVISVVEEGEEETEGEMDEDIYTTEETTEGPTITEVTEETIGEALATSVEVSSKELEAGKGVIKKHKPQVVVEHAPNTVCCLNLKTWAVWLLEITHNAHNWTKWIADIIRKVREFASIIRGDVRLPNGEKKVLYKEEWRQFAKETEENIIAWRQYSAHVRELSNTIIENYHGKEVTCCPKCLQDHLIKNVVTVHDTLQALTEAINCAGYWQRSLDELVERASHLTGVQQVEDQQSISSSTSSGFGIIEDVYLEPKGFAGKAMHEEVESLYEIEDLNIHEDAVEEVKPKAHHKKRKSSLADKKHKAAKRRSSNKAK